ncbi:hypothetical protein MKZ38_003568 [Zalerion maritima]|uniref:Leucine-rich repeat-containing protein 40 n=1 Tax=Zalerion maritima TaxID=339359 RepID=A0AAD5WSB9_9PEZI|nr:hypothetical protein MKZ38_003568 [Zalerion maritima]
MPRSGAQAQPQKPAAAPPRATPSKESLGGDIRNPRLRPSASRDQISGPPKSGTTTATTASTRAPAPGPRRVASKPTLNRPGTTKAQALRTSASQTFRSQQEQKAHQAQAAAEQEKRPAAQSLSRKSSRDVFSHSTGSIGARRNSGNDTIRPRKSMTLTRRPSQQLHSVASPTGASSTDDAASPLEDVGEETSFDTLQVKRKPRPSLAERTIETLANLPSSPAIRKSRSGFLAQDPTQRPMSHTSNGSRPSSSHNSDGSARPSSRDSRGSFKPSLSSVRATPATTPATTPAKRTSTVAKTLRTPASRQSLGTTPSRLIASAKGSMAARSPSPEKRQPTPKLKYGAKTVAVRNPKPRPPPGGMNKKPLMPTMGDSKRNLVSDRSSLTSETNPSSASTASGGTALTAESVEPSPALTFRKSSAALRDQIAKAKAANRAASRQFSQSTPVAEEPVIPTDNTFDFGLNDDPFNLGINKNTQEKVIKSRINTARTSGRLNIAALGLKEIPEQVMKMFDLDSVGGVGSAWAESVDLTRFVAADNELEVIDESVFPDCDPAALADDEDSRGNIFGGLETLDLHGNALISLPLGLRRLELMTSLNLSSNRLTNNCFDVISQIASLRDLKLSNNLLYGPLETNFNQLVNLEILDIHSNSVSAFPDGIESLSRLRILNISENSFGALPFASLSKLPLTEINARKNQLSGVLIQDGVESMPTLQSFDVGCNQLTHLTSSGSTISFPAMHQITLGMNRLQALPDVSSWGSMLTLTVDENSLTVFPDGLFGLEKLRHADFSSNDIRGIPAEIARMDNLTMLRISGNPLREKKFASMTTDEMKASLAARLEPLPHEVDAEPEPITFFELPPRKPSAALREKPFPPCVPAEPGSEGDDFATPPTSIPGTPVRGRSQTNASQTWPVKAGGILDRSSTESSSLHPVVCSKIAAEHRVYEIRIHHNLFASFPNSLSFFAETLRSLSLSHNQLVGETYLIEELELPALRELSLSSNHITGLQALAAHLRAPELTKLDVSLNRVTSLPPLREKFPNLLVLLLTNNHLEDLDPNSIRGLEVVDASNNDIAHLNPKLGLLGGSKGTLKRLEVTGNRFRVPRWNVLDRGTEATLKWLRSRVPVAEMAEWKKELGGGSNGSNDGDTD